MGGVNNQLLNGVSYKVYVALVSQEGTSAPTAIILQNTLGGTPVWSRDSAGTYDLTLSSAFEGNVGVICSDQTNDGFNLVGGKFYGDDNFLRFFADEAIGAPSLVEIRVYP